MIEIGGGRVVVGRSWRRIAERTGHAAASVSGAAGTWTGGAAQRLAEHVGGRVVSISGQRTQLTGSGRGSRTVRILSVAHFVQLDVGQFQIGSRSGTDGSSGRFGSAVDDRIDRERVQRRRKVLIEIFEVGPNQRMLLMVVEW